MRLNNKKAFSLIELLVVLVLIGIVGMVAIPNVKDFFAERELRAAVFKIASIVNGLKSELDSSKSDPTTNLNYEMAQILMGSDNNGFFINTKLRDSEKDNIKISALDTNITTLNELESSVSALLNTVQTNLNIPEDKKIDPSKVIEEASSSDASSGNFMTKLLGAEAAAILGSMAAATVLMLGGGKYKRRKFTKRRQNKKQKSTKSNKK